MPSLHESTDILVCRDGSVILTCLGRVWREELVAVTLDELDEPPDWLNGCLL